MKWASITSNMYIVKNNQTSTNISSLEGILTSLSHGMNSQKPTNRHHHRVSCSSSARSRHWHSLILNSHFSFFFVWPSETSIHGWNNFDLITQCLHSSHLNFILHLCLGHGTFSTYQVNSKYKMALANMYKMKSPPSITFFCSYQFKPTQRSQKSQTQKSQIIQP